MLQTKKMFAKIQEPVQVMVEAFVSTKFFLSVASKMNYDDGIVFTENNIVAYLAELEEYIGSLITYMAFKRDDPNAATSAIPLAQLNEKKFGQRDLEVSQTYAFYALTYVLNLRRSTSTRFHRSLREKIRYWSKLCKTVTSLARRRTFSPRPNLRPTSRQWLSARLKKSKRQEALPLSATVIDFKILTRMIKHPSTELEKNLCSPNRLMIRLWNKRQGTGLPQISSSLLCIL